MAVAILGPLTVTAPAGGDEIHLGPRDRVVLAALAAWPAQTLSPERLADALWGDQPPASWNKVVQGCVARVRRGLGTDAVTTTPQGYRLALPAGEVDARRFERLCGRAAELLALREPDRASYALGEALALWRGRALVDLEAWEPARAEAERLERLRQDAEELRIDAELRAGRCRTALGDAHALTAAEPLRERRWALLALAQHQAGAQADALATLRRARAVLARELGIDPGAELTTLEQRILRQDPGLLVPAGPVESSSTCPYPGLLAYDVADAEAFFGREADVAACLQRLGTAGVLVVIGPSGCGKSSLVRAGVVAALRRAGRTVRVVTPGRRPSDVVASPGAASVLVVDQCEEAVTMCRDPAEQAGFFAALVEHAARGPLVVALRADQLGAVSAHTGFARLVEQGLYLLGAMDEADLRAAIEGPARQSGLLVEPGLVDLLVREVVGEPSALPLLSHALRQTWLRREGRTLTVSGYRDSGGIRDSLARTAEEIFGTLSDVARDNARQLFLRLVTPGEGGENLRHRISHDELLSLRADVDEIDAALQAFGAARLLSFDRDPETTGSTVEIAHEALLKEWTRLRVWVDESREHLRIGRRLALAAKDWLDSGRELSFLASGTRLDQFAVWRDRSGLAITSDERDFLRAALAEQARQHEVERARQGREEALRRRALRRLRAVVAVLAAAALVASGLTTFAVAQRRRALQQARAAAVRELSAAAVASLDVDPERSLLLALRAVDLTRTVDGSVRPEAREALHRAVVASRVVLRVPGTGGSLAWSPTAPVFATEGPEESGKVEIRSAVTGEVVGPRFAGHAKDVNDVAFSPDGSMLATGGDDGLLKVWNAQTGAELRRLSGPNPQAHQPTFSGDGRLVAAFWREDGSDAGVVQLADLTTGRSRVMAVAGNPTAVALNRAGTRLAIATDNPNSVLVLDASTGGLLYTLRENDPYINGVAWSPDGKWLATAEAGGVARIWDAATGRLWTTLSGHGAQVWVVAWSPDSSRLATGGLDGTVKLWTVDEEGARAVLTLSAFDLRSWVYGIAFSGDGTRLMASDKAMTSVRIWDVGLTGDAEVINLPADATWIGRPGFTPDGRSVYAGTEPGSASVWNLATGTESLRIPSGRPNTHLGLATGAVTLPIAGADGSVTLWDAATADRVLTVPSASQGVAISPDGQYFAVNQNDDPQTRIVDRWGNVVQKVREDAGFHVTDMRFGAGDGHLLATGRIRSDRPNPAVQQVTVWDWPRGRIVAVLHTVADTVAFDPTGARAVSIAEEPALWDVRTGRKTSTLTGEAGQILDATFSPDGSLVATAGDDGTVRLWDGRSGIEQLTLRGHHAAVRKVAFSPDGSRLVSVGLDGTLRVWELNLDRLVATAKRELTRGLTTEECRQYLHLDQCPAS